MRHAVIVRAALILIFLVGLGAQTEPRYQVLFNRYLVPVMTLHIADADGKRERAVLSSPSLDYSPTYSRDGQWITFTSERDGQAEIYRVHPDGSDLQRLTEHAAFDDQAALSPDGKTLAFVSTRDGGTANIWLMDLASKKTTNLTASRSGHFRPSWSPDGQWIAFTSDRDARPGDWPGRWEHLQSTGVYVISARGGDLRRLTGRMASPEARRGRPMGGGFCSTKLMSWVRISRRAQVREPKWSRST